MPLTISETLLDGNGSAVSGANIYCDASVHPLLVNQGAAGFQHVANAGHFAVAVTNASGVWTLTLPWPDHCDPASVAFILTMPDGSQWQGKVPQGVSGPVSIETLKTSYGWTTLSGSSTSLQIVQTPPAASPYILASAYGALGTADDTLTIQSAINAAAAAGGGTVLVPAGAYIVSALVLGNRVWLRGTGMHATTLLQKANTSGDMITNHVSSGSQSDPDALFCGVLDLMLDGNKANQTAANNAINWNSYNSTTFNIYAGQGPDDDNDTHQLVQNVFIVNFKGSACVGSSRGEHRYINVHTLLCDKYGFNTTYDAAFIGCVAGQSGLEGFFLAATNVRVVGCKAFYSGRINNALGHGFHLIYSTAAGLVTLASCEAQDNKADGFLVDNCNRCTLVGCTADSNSTQAAGAYVAFDIYAANYIRIEGCVAVDRSPAGQQTQTYALQIRQPSSANRISITHSYVNGTQPTTFLKPQATLKGNNLLLGSMGATDIATVAAAGTYTPDPYGKGDTAMLTLSGTVTIANPATGHEGCKLTIVMIDTAAHTITWGSQFVGGKPTASFNGRTITQFLFDGTNWNLIGSNQN